MTIRHCALIVALLLFSRSGGMAQTPGTPPRSPVASAVRPVVVAIEFVGNASITPAELLYNMESKPTSNSSLQRFFDAYAKLMKANRRFAPRYRVMLEQLVDSLRGNIRYYNSARAASDTAVILRVYQNRGFHDARVTWGIRTDSGNTKVAIRYLIDEGKRYAIQGVGWLGMNLDTLPSEVRQQLLDRQFAKDGEPFAVELVNAERDRAVRILRDHGFPFALGQGVTVITRRDTAAGRFTDSLLLQVYCGRRYRFGTTSHRSDSSHDGTPVDRSLVLGQVEYKPGDWYSDRALEQTRANLNALGVFDRVRIDRVTHGDSSDLVDITFATQLRPQWNTEGAVEVAAEKRVQGWRILLGLSGSLAKTNWLGRAERFSLGGRVAWRPAEGGRLEWEGNLGGHIPSFGSSRIGLSASVSYSDLVEAKWVDRNDVEGVLRDRRVRVVGEAVYRFPVYTFFSNAQFFLNFQYNQYSGVGGYISDATVNKTGAGLVNYDCAFEVLEPDRLEQLYGAIENAMRSSIYRLQVLQGDDINLLVGRDTVARQQFNDLKRTYIGGVTLLHDTRNNFFQPNSGDFLNTRLELGLTGAFNGGFGKLEFDYRYHTPSGFRSSWAFRGHAGWIVQFGEFPLTPVNSRFTAGGANSIRGWGVRDLLVTAPAQLASFLDSIVGECAVPILREIDQESRRLQGGLGVIELSAEYRSWLFDLPTSSTLNQQLNQLQFMGYLDIGNAYFRDYTTDSSLVNLGSIVENLAGSVGMGLGYSTPFGPIRVGFGYKFYDPVDRIGPTRWFWNRPLTLGDVSWHLAIGHAF
ncbi:MAG: BamA/TamA family outer membrane protein [Chlorobi bacterium]|nr:BamA/TamA family outer membrane protein [Chlorobiota bacterium]MBX7215830.1 BamA/TamA family outer membrane protein [Candidatus Kapabacteria bacterium]